MASTRAYVPLLLGLVVVVAGWAVFTSPDLSAGGDGGTLEVGDHDDVPQCRIALFEQCARPCDGGGEIRVAVADLGTRERGPQHGTIRCQLLGEQRLVIEEQQGGAVAGFEGIDRVTGDAKRILPRTVRLHAVGSIEKNDAIVAIARRSEAIARPFDERLRERDAEQRDDCAAEHKQPPVPNRAPTVLTNRNVLQKHERGEREGRALFAAHQVHQDRDRDRGEAGEKQRCQESQVHQRTCILCWRSVRYSKSA